MTTAGYQDSVMKKLERLAESHGLSIMLNQKYANTGTMLVGNGPGLIAFTVEYGFYGTYVTMGFATVGDKIEKSFRLSPASNDEYRTMEAHFQMMCERFGEGS